jgi:hypothetical protein
MENDLYEVWHVKQERARELRDSELSVVVRFPHDYQLVARVQARCLDEVFDKTCDTGDPWWRNRGVECLKESRSTTVNDIVRTPHKEVYAVVPKGWQLLHSPALEQGHVQEQKPKLAY